MLVCMANIKANREVPAFTRYDPAPPRPERPRPERRALAWCYLCKTEHTWAQHELIVALRGAAHKEAAAQAAKEDTCKAS
jgi:hypothetical protein